MASIGRDLANGVTAVTDIFKQPAGGTKTGLPRVITRAVGQDMDANNADGQKKDWMRNLLATGIVALMTLSKHSDKLPGFLGFVKSGTDMAGSAVPGKVTEFWKGNPLLAHAGLAAISPAAAMLSGGAELLTQGVAQFSLKDGTDFLGGLVKASPDMGKGTSLLMSIAKVALGVLLCYNAHRGNNAEVMGKKVGLDNWALDVTGIGK